VLGVAAVLLTAIGTGASHHTTTQPGEHTILSRRYRVIDYFLCE